MMYIDELDDAIEGSIYTPYIITWEIEEGDALNLTGAAITGIRHNRATGVNKALTGTMTVTDAAAGKFQWTPSTTDVSDVGLFLVQFTATIATKAEISKRARWRVLDRLEVTA